MQFRFRALGLIVALAASIGAGAPNAQQLNFAANLPAVEEMRTEQRVALVIGNSAYGPEIGSLANPANDAADLAQALQAAGFKVTLKLDVDRDQMLRAVADFGRSLREGGVGLFYYAGHAVQVNGANYLIPLGANVEEEDYIQIETVDIEQVIGRMGGADNRLNIVVLDACRNNPFQSNFRSVTRGLAPTLAPTGTYIAYAAAPGQLALDGDSSRNSPYTNALVDVLAEPGLRLEDVFKRVGARVLTETRGKQTPWTSSSITGDFYFRLPEVARAEPAPPQARATLIDVNVWSAIANSQDPGDFEVFLETFPDSPLAPFARRRLTRLQSTEVAALATQEQAERSPTAAISGGEPRTEAFPALPPRSAAGPERRGSTSEALGATPQAVQRDLAVARPEQDQYGAASPPQSRRVVEPAAGPFALFRTPSAEEPRARQGAQAGVAQEQRPAQLAARTPEDAAPEQQQMRNVEGSAGSLSARLQEEQKEDASKKVRQLDLAAVSDLSECKAFVDDFYDDGLRTNASKFQTCAREGGRSVLYQQPACGDPVWSRMQGPERCRPFVEYACKVYTKKTEFLSKCERQLATRQ